MSQTAAPEASTAGSQPTLGVTDGKLAMWIFLGSDGMSFMGLIAAYVALRGGNAGTWPEPTDHLAIDLTAFNTFVLICSSVSMVKAFLASQNADKSGMVKWLGATIFGGLVFLGIQVYEYTHQINSGFTVSGFSDEYEVRKRFETIAAEAEASGAPSPVTSVAEFAAAEKFLDHSVSHDADEAAAAFTAAKEVLDRDYPKTKIGESEGLFCATFYVLTCFHGCHVASGVIYLAIILLGVLRNRWTVNRMEIVGLYWHFVDLVWIVIFTIVYLVENRVTDSV